MYNSSIVGIDNGGMINNPSQQQESIVIGNMIGHLLQQQQSIVISIWVL